MTAVTTHDPLARLLAVEPLPRGERLARSIDSPRRTGKVLMDPLWGRLIDRGRVLHPLDEVFVYKAAVDSATLWREYAAPLRRCRDERRRLRERLTEVVVVAMNLQLCAARVIHLAVPALSPDSDTTVPSNVVLFGQQRREP